MHMVMADFGCSRGGESAWPDGSSASVGRGRYVMGSAADEGRSSGRLTGHHSINQRLERFYETLKLVLFLQSSLLITVTFSHHNQLLLIHTVVSVVGCASNFSYHL